MFAGIEGRGTEFVVVLGEGPGEVASRVTYPATSPQETLALATGYIRDQGGADAVGIACFGPLDLERGLVTFTLKPGWQNFPLVDTVREALGVPVTLTTDVNAAAVAEAAARGVDDLVFVTIGTGTGIGAGVVAGGAPVHGRSHPEVGHLTVRRHPSDSFAGVCPYHGDCLEGLATGKAMAARGPVEGALELQAFYLAQLVTAMTYVTSPQLVVIDGALPRETAFIPALRLAVAERFGTDPAVAGIVADLENYLQPSILDGDAAALGALALASRL